MHARKKLKSPFLPVVSALTLSAIVGCQPNVQEVPDLQDVEQEQTPIVVDYPETVKGNQVDTYFTYDVADPYRWLEDDRSAATEAWVMAQNAATNGYMNNVTFKEEITETLKALYNYERVSAPLEHGDYEYFYKNDGLQNQAVVYRQKDGEEPEVFIDPNTLSDDGTVALSLMRFSSDGSLVAYQTSTGGSDWRDVYVMNTETKELIGEPLRDLKFSELAWYGNEGFFYSAYDKPEGSELSAKTDQHKLYFHKVGTSQSEDVAVFGHTDEEKHRYVFAAVADNRYLVIYAMVATSGNRVFIKDLTQPNAPVIPVKQSLDSDAEFLVMDGDTIYMKTNAGAPNAKVIAMDVNNPTDANWQDVIPEAEHALTVTHAGGYFFAEYMVDAISQVKQYTLSGELVREVALPSKGSVESSGRSMGDIASFKGKKSDTYTYYMFENYITPKTTYRFDIATGESTLVNSPATTFDANEYVSKQVFYTSKDGTEVPMFITHKKGIVLDGTAPTMLYGYGGFNISLPPRYSPNVAAWLELGGIYAVPNIRGGGEYGKEWHRAGTQQQKQNVFDDFIAAGEYLIANNYTSSEKMALYGRSNGGLLVGAVMTQRPDLAKVALPAVGVLDMLRYHTFTAGAGWAYDYGTSEQSEEMFKYLLAYSPVHNVKEGVEYPATMITTADHDDRVVPAHSFKFAAELQDKQTGTNPTLIRIDVDAGHGAGTPVSKTIDLYADMYGFALFNFGIRTLD